MSLTRHKKPDVPALKCSLSVAYSIIIMGKTGILNDSDTFSCSSYSTCYAMPYTAGAVFFKTYGGFQELSYKFTNYVDFISSYAFQST